MPAWPQQAASCTAGMGARPLHPSPHATLQEVLAARKLKSLFCHMQYGKAVLLRP